MRRLLVFSTLAFVIFSIALIFLPLGTIALIPVILGSILGYLTLKRSPEGRKKILPKIFLGLLALSGIVMIAKTTLVKNEVVEDTQFDERIEESEQDAIDELETELKDVDLEELELEDLDLEATDSTLTQELEGIEDTIEPQ